MHFQTAVIALALALLGSGCASTKQILPAAALGTTVAGGKSKIVVSRPTKMFGGAVGFQIYDGTNHVGKLGPGGILSWEREPGLVNLEGRFDMMGTSKSIHKQFYIDTGEVQVVRMDILASGFDNRLEFRLLGKEDSEKVLSTRRE